MREGEEGRLLQRMRRRFLGAPRTPWPATSLSWLLGELSSDPEIERIVTRLMSERARLETTRAFLQLPLCLGLDGVPIGFADRRDGIPCGQVGCPLRYLLAPLLEGSRSRERVVGRQAQDRGQLWRYFVDIELRGAVTVECMDLMYVSERSLRDGDPRAIAFLCAFRQAGADVLWIRGGGSGRERIAVIFMGAVGAGIEVLDEAPYALIENCWRRGRASPAGKGAGGQLAADPHTRAGSHAERFRSLLGWRRGVRHGLTFVAWELAVALGCALAAPSIARLPARLIGVEVTFPLWAVVVVSVLLGWLVARAYGRFRS